MSLHHYPELTAQKAEVKASEYHKKSVKNSYLPQLQLQLQNTHGTYVGGAGAFFPLPGIFNVNNRGVLEQQPDVTTSFYSSAVVDWRLLEFGRRSKEVAIASYQEEAAKSNLRVTQLSVQTTVSRLYLAILYNQANAGWARANANRLQQIMGLSTSMAEAGLKPGADTLLALSAYQQALAESDNWQGKLAASRIRLTELVPLSPDSFQVSAPTYLTATTTPAISQNADPVADSHPYLEVHHQQVQVAAARQELTERRVFPTLSLLGGVSSRGSGIGADGTVSDSWGAGFDNKSNNYLLGLGLTWNLTSAYNSGPESKEAGQQLEATKAQYDKQALELNTALQAVETSLNEQVKQVSTSRKAVENARKAYELYLSRYENGLISMTELLQLQFLLQQYERANIEAHQQFWSQVLAQAELSGDFTYLSEQF